MFLHVLYEIPLLWHILLKPFLIIIHLKKENESYTPQDLGVGLRHVATARILFTLRMQAFGIYPSTLTYGAASEVASFTS